MRVHSAAHPKGSAQPSCTRVSFGDLKREYQECGTYGVGDIFRGREDDCGNPSRTNERPTGPEAIHLEQHPAEIWTRQISCPQGIPEFLATASIHRDNIFDENIERRRHRRAPWRGGNPEGGLKTAHSEDIKREVYEPKIEHDGGEGHGKEADWRKSAAIIRQ
jgi:hypothetical protein